MRSDIIAVGQNGQARRADVSAGRSGNVINHNARRRRCCLNRSSEQDHQRENIQRDGGLIFSFSHTFTENKLPHRSFSGDLKIVGGRERIRTSGRVTPTSDFESDAFNHSATLPASGRFVIHFQ